MDESRLSRLETRVDEIKDDVADIKAEQKISSYEMIDLKQSIKEQTEVIKSHVAGDNKIITQIEPVIREFQFQQERKRRRIASLKEFGLKLGIPATIVGTIGVVVKIWFSF